MPQLHTGQAVDRMRASLDLTPQNLPEFPPAPAAPAAPAPHVPEDEISVRMRGYDAWVPA